jgi:hypothetical protein
MVARLLCRLSTASGLLIAGTAHADDLGGKSHVAPILPTVQVSASTSGTADAKAAADIAAGLSGDWDIVIAPVVTVSTTSGIGTLFSFSNDEASVPSPWSLGGTLTFLRLTSLPDAMSPAASPFVQRAFREAKRTVYDTCARVCDASSDDDCKKFTARRTELLNKALLRQCQAAQKKQPALKCEHDDGTNADTIRKTCLAKADSRTAREACDSLVDDAVTRFCQIAEQKGSRCSDELDGMHDPTRINPGDLCEAGSKEWLTYEAKHMRDIRAQFPLWQLSIGGAGGVSQHKYLLAGADNALADTTSQEDNWRVAASVAHVEPSNGFTFEAAGGQTSQFTDASSTAQWCVPIGTVNGAPAQKCSTRTLGPPSQLQETWGEVLFGYVNVSAIWRAAIGPTGSFDYKTQSGTVGVAAPVYWNFASLPAGYVGDYKGLIRLTPAVVFHISQFGAVDTRISLTLEILGKRTLFGRALDYP